MARIDRKTRYKSLVPIILTLGLLSIAADALGSDFSLLDDQRSRLERCIDRCERNHPPLPSSTPAPTRTPTPTAVVDCSDGSFGYDPSRKTLTYLNRVYEPGRFYRLCMRVRADMPAPSGTLQVDSVNHGNASCNVFHLLLTSPSGVTRAYEPMIAPIARAPFEVGTWGVTLMLDVNDRCGDNPGLSMWAYGF